MSLIEEVASQIAAPLPEVLSSGCLPDFAAPTGRVLLVWDAPNLDMGLGSILGRRPTALERPRFDALGRWLLARTADIAANRPDLTIEPEATVFTNIATGSAEVVRPWVDALRNVGFAVFAKPKIDEDSDVDNDMLEHIAQRNNEGLAALVLASADGQAFRQPLEDVARSGISVYVLGFREHASWALASDTLEFVDLEDTLVFSGSRYRESAWILCLNRGLGCSRFGRCRRC